MPGIFGAPPMAVTIISDEAHALVYPHDNTAEIWLSNNVRAPVVRVGRSFAILRRDLTQIIDRFAGAGGVFKD